MMNRMFEAGAQDGSTVRCREGRRARWASAGLWALCLLPLAACEPRFGEGNTVPPTPPTQPTPDSSPAPAVPGQ